MDLLPAWRKLIPAPVMNDLEDVLANCVQPVLHPFLNVFLYNNGVVVDICDRNDPFIFIRRSKRISDSQKIELLFEETRDVWPVVFCTGQSDEQFWWSCSCADKVIDPGVQFVSLCSSVSC